MGLRIVLSPAQLTAAQDLAEKTVANGEKYEYFQPDGLSHDVRVERFRVAYAGEFAVAGLYDVKPSICYRDFSKPVKSRGFQADVFYKDTCIQVKTTRKYGRTRFDLKSPTLAYVCYCRDIQKDIQIVTTSYDTEIKKVSTGYLLEVPEEKWRKIEK